MDHELAEAAGGRVMAVLEVFEPRYVIETKAVPQLGLLQVITDEREQAGRCLDQVVAPRMVLGHSQDEPGEDLPDDRDEAHVVDGHSRNRLSDLLQSLVKPLLTVVFHQPSVVDGGAVRR